MKNLELIIGQVLILGLTTGVLYYIIKNEYKEEKKDLDNYKTYLEHLREKGL